MKPGFRVIFLIIFAAISLKADKPAYQFYNAKRKQVDYKKVLKQAKKADVILFGEIHNNPLCHWLQLELSRDLGKERDLVLGAEMFESDQQLIINEYLKGIVSDRNFENYTHTWNNFKTDYKPLLDFAREKNYSFIATNIPRRYASYLAYNGTDSLKTLSKQAKSYFVELPFPYDSSLSNYSKIQKMGMHGMPYIAKAQAIKDATMARNIIENLNEGELFIHYNGTYHSNNYQGIYWYLKKYKPELNILSIASTEKETISNFDEEKDAELGDFILYLPKNMTKTY